MEYIEDLIKNYVMASAFMAWLIAQLIKVVIAIFDKDERTLVKVLFSNGGMPSSHSSCVSALCVACALQEGVGSALFAVSFILACVVMIDASGVRYETGKQAKIINQITRKLFSEDSSEVNAGLKELVGHTPFQVLMGSLLGIAVAVAMAFLMGRL